jgi:hypothetical protein|tara:strand:- start:882 stop:1163 length:282 start_codon:yes stop_codon:yes gene_type:complete
VAEIPMVFDDNTATIQLTTVSDLLRTKNTVSEELKRLATDTIGDYEIKFDFYAPPRKESEETVEEERDTTIKKTQSDIFRRNYPLMKIPDGPE